MERRRQCAGRSASSSGAPADVVSDARGAAGSVALLHWGDVIEDFLDTISISLESFRDDMSGGWMFGYVEALRRADVETVLVCISARVAEPVRWRHRGTGAAMWVLPVPDAYVRLRRRLRHRYSSSARDAIAGTGARALALGVVAREVAPYVATPLRSLAGVVQREGCGALLCQEYEYPRFDTCVLLGRLMRLPVFATFQGGDNQLALLERPLRPLALHACNGLIIGPRAEVERVRARYGVPPRKIAQIFNPLDVTTWQPRDRDAARAELGLGAQAAVVAWHGRIDIGSKGLDVLLEAWKRLSDERVRADLVLLLIGSGSDAPELREQITEMGLPGVRWIDEYVLDRDRLCRHLSAADIYAFPSRHEGFAVAPLEAMACGLPVVACDGPGIADVLAGGEASGGVSVPQEDAGAFADALRFLITDLPKRRELGRLARQRVEREFSLESVGRELRCFLLGGDESAS